MGTVVSFNNERQKKQINLEKKLLRELSLEKMLISAEECFAPLFYFFLSTRISCMTAASILPLKHICWEPSTGSSAITENPFNERWSAQKKKKNSFCTSFMNMLSAGLKLLIFKRLMNRFIMPANTLSKAGGKKASASGKDALSFDSDKMKFYVKVRPS